jgi:hypothetical protein
VVAFHLRLPEIPFIFIVPSKVLRVYRVLREYRGYKDPVDPRVLKGNREFKEL